jgi:hypothetical protein
MSIAPLRSVRRLLGSVCVKLVPLLKFSLDTSEHCAHSRSNNVPNTLRALPHALLAGHDVENDGSRRAPPGGCGSKRRRRWRRTTFSRELETLKHRVERPSLFAFEGLESEAEKAADYINLDGAATRAIID